MAILVHNKIERNADKKPQKIAPRDPNTKKKVIRTPYYDAYVVELLNQRYLLYSRSAFWRRKLQPLDMAEFMPRTAMREYSPTLLGKFQT